MCLLVVAGCSLLSSACMSVVVAIVGCCWLWLVPLLIAACRCHKVVGCVSVVLGILGGVGIVGCLLLLARLACCWLLVVACCCLHVVACRRWLVGACCWLNVADCLVMSMHLRSR